MPGPTLAVIKRLFALSRNKCTFSGCEAPIVEDSGTVTGEICHIKAASPGGPRYDPMQSESERHAASNLLLLCGRHHTLIDAEPTTYTVQKLTELKRLHEQGGIAELSPSGAKAAARLLENYTNVVIHSNTGQVAIQSPGAIQANTITLKTTKAKLAVAPPSGSIAEDRAMMSYTKYLIDRYQEFQKADTTKPGRFKYMAIHAALKRQFKGDWKLLSSSRFTEVVTFLQRRINNTMLGRINKSRGTHNYHGFEEHS